MFGTPRKVAAVEEARRLTKVGRRAGNLLIPITYGGDEGEPGPGGNRFPNGP